MTAGVLATANLQAQIDGLQRAVMAGRAAAGDRAQLIELVALRGQVLGRISDYEWAEKKAEQLAREVPAEGTAFVARAHARARFHRLPKRWPTWIGRSGLAPTSSPRTPNAPASSRQPAATSWPSRSTARPPSARPIPAPSGPWPRCTPTAGTSPPRSGCSTRAETATEGSRRSRWRCSTSGAASCG